MYCVVLFETLTHTLTHTFRPPRSSRRPRFDLVQKAVASDKASHRPLTLAQVARPATSLKRPEPLTSSNGAAAALNLNGGARRKPPLSQLGPAALAGHYEIRQLRLHSMQIAVLFVRSCAASHSPLNPPHLNATSVCMCGANRTYIETRLFSLDFCKASVLYLARCHVRLIQAFNGQPRCKMQDVVLRNSTDQADTRRT